MDNAIKKLGFKVTGNHYLFKKGDLTIKINTNYEVDYDKIKISRKNICKLEENNENLVHLELVIRLLNLGYSYKNLVLEKPYSLGHNSTSGYADVVIEDSNQNTWAIIDCKTFGKEYIKAKENLKENFETNQLLSYYVNDKNAKILSFYTSKISNQIEFQFDYLQPTNKMKSAVNLQSVFEEWDKVLISKGFLSNNSKPFQTVFDNLKYTDLREIKNEDSNYIFNEFLEILRRNIISDKSNAFNKIFNLFICKIIDEDINFNDNLAFQWLQTDNFETFINRIQNLYKKGMETYLNVKISKNLGDEFTFKEVFDEKTFDDNCKIVKEIVQLLEPYQLKYLSKQQYLGDFFEKLLNTGIKQEAGQFFTPIPLASFICSCIPIEEIIERKNNSGEINFLPYVIDYASGSGHFITEIIQIIENKIKLFDISHIKGGKSAISNFINTKNNYIWCREYVYGIEKDYRLAKTTKVNSFLNGDGEANIYSEDGLSSFKCKGYSGKLSSKNYENSNFDILVANPPYSISNFKSTLVDGKNSFKLFNFLKPNSNEIENLFIERSSQLLSQNGYAGIILPRSVLTDKTLLGIETRKLLLENFELKSLVLLGTQAFAATDIMTTIFFMKRTNNPVNEKILICNLENDDNRIERDWLGYNAKKKRKGYDGIELYEDNILKPETDTNSELHLNYYIKTALLNGNIQKYFDKDGVFKADIEIQKVMRLEEYDKIIDRDNYIINSISKDFAVTKYNFESKKLDYFVTNSLKNKKNLSGLLSGKRPKGGVDRIRSGILSIGGRQLGEDGELNLDQKEFVTKEFAKNLNNNLTIEKNDILVTKDGARTGKTVFIFDKPKEDSIINEHVFILRVDQSIIDPYLIFLILYSSIFRNFISNFKTKGGQGGLNKDTFSSFEIPITDENITKLIIQKINKDDFRNIKKDKDRLKLVDEVLSEILIKN